MDYLDYIDERVDELEQQARAIVSNYWGLRNAINDERKKDRSNLGCRVISKKGYFSIVWYWNTYDNPKGSEPFSHYISKGIDSKQYPINALKKKARTWEVDMVVDAERMFADIREQLAILAELRRKHKTLNRLQGKTINGMKERNIKVSQLEDLEELEDCC